MGNEESDNINTKNILLVLALLISAALFGGYLRQTGVLEKSGDQINSDLRNYAVRVCADYLYDNPNGAFNETAKKIYKDLTGHEYYQESMYDWAWRMRNMKTIPNTGMPCNIKCP